MNKYYDLVLADLIATYKSEDLNIDLPGTGFSHLPEEERWKKVKESFLQSQLRVITEWGLIDFDPTELKTLVGGDGLTYDVYLDLQKESAKKSRKAFSRTYYEAIFAIFKGKIERIITNKNKICFQKIYIYGQYSDGNGFVEKEDHVWMNLNGFEKYRVGDCLEFEAEVYRYVKRKNGKMIDFGLQNPIDIQQIGEYVLPTDEQLQLQAADEIICNDLCMFKEQCNGLFCLANEEWRESMRSLFMNKK